ncbi:aminodeoxychorismate/anthranilate synthase component II [Pseudoalteromonas sp. S558]|uniref:aminodeoxychorismate/anthranilate synthase component II n=1 Tax=Pseudoalteromonas sp. S558 TaxID=2066515 RepID=UPI00110ADBD1|nr:aminodeoxychorismate/anthranilate synthase component II [Pseudoalteromonas sp. S558]TMO08543.1 anthranilate synthase component II [Pseudoalteromonas sp. S558]
MSKANSIKIYFLDNFDSFTYNLVDELTMLGCELVVYRNNISAEVIFNKMRQEQGQVLLVLSPGPGTPNDAGCLMELIELSKGHFPMLGICLGQQALTQSYGGVIGHAGETVHGKSSIINLGKHPVFDGMGNTMPVARYHSLMATKVPDNIKVIAQYEDIPMAIYHHGDNALGYQFHPESILTPNGAMLLQQSVAYLTRAK